MIVLPKMNSAHARKTIFLVTRLEKKILIIIIKDDNIDNNDDDDDNIIKKDSKTGFIL